MSLAHLHPPSRKHYFNDSLKVEAKFEHWPELLFGLNKVLDVSKVKTEQRKGNDFLLIPSGHPSRRIRCENKFEQYTTGRVALEWISIDRPSLKPGWMASSHTAWLLSWFCKSGDLIAMPMDELRRVVLRNPARNKATTAFNPPKKWEPKGSTGYLSWSTLEDLNWILSNVPGAGWVDLRNELGLSFESPSLVKGAAKDALIPAEELVHRMLQSADQSTPVAVSDEVLLAMARELNRVNLKREDASHQPLIKRLLP